MDYLKELKKRKNLRNLLTEKYEKMGNPIPEFIIKNGGKLAFITSHLASSSMIDYQFFGEARKRGLIPVWLPFQEDIFQSCNGRKLMFLYTYDKFGNIQKLTNPNKWNGRKLSEIVLDSGENLVDFHRQKWKQLPEPKACIDCSKWVQFFGTAEDYYFHDMSLCAAFGLKLRTQIPALYQMKGEKEKLLVRCKNPAKERVKKEYDVEVLEHEFLFKPTLF